MGKFLVVASLAALAFGSTPGNAQSLTDEEMLTRFKTQRDVFNSAAQADGSQDLRTRGLTIVTIGDETPAQAGAVTIENNNTASNQPLDPNMPLVAARFDPSLSVDVRIEFDFDSAAISRNQQPALDQICRVMTQATDINLFRIVGHTDSSGSDEYNQRLSTLRAKEVGRYLVDDCGISPSRLEMVGYGEKFLAIPEDSKAAANRRVEFQALG